MLDFYRRQRFVKAISRDSLLTVRESRNCEVATTQGSTLMMPELSPFAKQEVKDDWDGMLVRECWKNKVTHHGDVVLKNTMGIDTTSTLGMAMDIVINSNVEHTEMGTYEGADTLVRKTRAKQLPELSSRIGELGDQIGPLVALDYDTRSEWQGIPAMNLREQLSPKGQAAYDKLAVYKDEYAQVREAGQPNYDMAVRMMEQLGMSEEELLKEAQANQQQGDNDEQKEPQEGKAQGREKGDGQGEPSEGSGEAEAEGNGEGEGEGNSEGNAGDDTGSPEGEGEGVGQEATVAYADLVSKDCTNANAYSGGGGLHIDYSEDDLNLRRPIPTATIKKLREMKPDTRHSSLGSHVLERTKFTLTSKVRNKLKVMSQAKWQGGKKRGKIKKKSLATIVAGNERIFKQKEQANVLDTAVTLLVDGSGSMQNDKKWIQAFESTLMLNNCLNKLNIPVEIIVFTGDGSSTTHLIVSEFNKRDTEQHVAAVMGNYNGFWYNNDGVSISFAHDRLIKQKQKRKLLITLSDGQPAGIGGIMGFTKGVIEEIEKKSPVEICAIGIEDDTVNRLYKNSSVVKSASQLEQALLDTLESSILRK